MNQANIQVEKAQFFRICRAEDMREGTTAFLEKRKASFKGC